MKYLGPLALAAALAVTSPALAQDRTGTVEFSIFGGGNFGGRLYSGSTVFFDRDVDVQTSGTYGGRLGVNLSRWFEIEGSWARADGNIESRGYGDGGLGGNGAPRLGKLRVDQYDGDLLVNFGKRKVRWYFAIGAGATTFRISVPDFDPSTDTRFSANLGGGVKVFFNPHVAIRLDGRARSTYINGGSCDHRYNNTCNRNDRYDSSNWYTTGEATGGLTFAF